MAKAGKLGQFEAKDMARYFPSMMPAASAAGFQGIEGLKKLSAVVQTIRSGTGTSEEAAGSTMNILAKMESEETAKKFKKFGVDLRTEMEKARKEGQNIFETFLDLSAKALKGDLSKLPQLFQDMEVQRGMRPLLATREKIKQFVDGMNDAAGTTAADLARVLANKQADIDKFLAAWDRFQTEVGRALARGIGGQGATGIMNRLSDHLSGSGSAAPGEVTKRLEAHIAATVNDQVERDVAEAAKIRERIFALRDRVAADPKFAERHDVGARAKQYRDQLAAITGRIASARMPKLGEGGNVYDMPGGLIVNNDPTVMERMREFKRFTGGSKFPAVNAPLPPTRPTDLPQTGPMPPLDFGAAVDSAKEAKTDIEAALRAIDLASAGAEAGSGFKNGLMNELKQAEPEIKSWADRVKSMLSFTATPKVTPGGLPTGKSGAGNERPPGSTMDGF
jgi:gas vesicle protein